MVKYHNNTSFRELATYQICQITYVKLAAKGVLSWRQARCLYVFRLFHALGRPTMILNGNEILQNIVYWREQDARKGVSMTTELESLLFFPDLSVLTLFTAQKMI